jgi:hypothetical protein
MDLKHRPVGGAKKCIKIFLSGHLEDLKGSGDLKLRCVLGTYMGEGDEM